MFILHFFFQMFPQSFDTQTPGNGLAISKVLFFFFGFFLGYASKFATLYKLNSSSCPDNYNYNLETSNSSVLEREKTEVSTENKFSEFLGFSKFKFACNSQTAYEELTRLYLKRQQLEEHNSRGEANRDRKATILRKTQQARSAEGSFKLCVKSMLPELLTKWEDDLKKGLLRRNTQWSDRAEEEIGGITLKTLEETTILLDKSTK